MASIIQRRGGKTIQFFNADGNRKYVSIGKITMRDAEKIKAKIEALNIARINATIIDVETASWLAKLPTKTYEKLVNVGLAEPRADSPKPVVATLGAFIDDYVTKRTDVKPATKEIWRQGKNGLIKFYGAEMPITDVTAGMAGDYKSKLLSDGLKPYTVSKRLQFANKIFMYAVDHELIAKNPFGKVKIKKTMEDRKYNVIPADVAKVLDACPNQDWRTIVALARWGGLRCPSEVLSITWADVHWPDLTAKNQRDKAGWVLVTSPKTAHHPGKESRTMPLFPELRSELERAFELAPEGAVYVVDEKHRKSAMGPSGCAGRNLSTTFKKIIRRAGLIPWPRPFHNMRSSRQTELAETFPMHVVCTWLGNSPDIAREHYLQVTDDHYGQAVSDGPGAQLNAQLSGVISRSTASHDATEDVENLVEIAKPLNSKTLQRRGWDSNPWCSVTRTPI